VAVEKMGGGFKSFHPIGRGKMGLKKKRTNDVVDRAQDMLSFPILLGGVGA
jgi:hypothetical protein